MIHFTYDQAYKLRYDIIQSMSKNDPAVKLLAVETFTKLDNYITMCQTIPVDGNPTLSVHDNWARYLTEFYQVRIQQ
ncbi:hypothetical protein Aeh1ORF290c [Aeromonas phage Aeh1]|uniref:Uncharacterized protein n=1 Tax=Aeromonas phage Aeh1 TaxID=2880362 RepID=Q76YD6_9CAUD|nr:hypothetical protein Aeh1p309 [Aeromonas phage Aeh1]AAQ17959.1 hypothetical protein Aeh1ORF290c [Aeromonas phage Aeh1]